MDITELQKQAKRDEQTDVSFYNPLTEDIVITYHSTQYTIPALNIVTYKKPLADFIKKAIADRIVFSQGNKNIEAATKAVYEKMEHYDTELD